MKRFVLGLVAAGIGFGCSETPSGPHAATFEATVPSPHDYVVTTVGLMHKSCVATVPSGSVVDDHRGLVTYPDGQQLKLGKCLYPVFPAVERPAHTPQAVTEPPLTHWVENDSATLAAGSVFHSLSVRWIVPATPTGSFGSAVYYAFPGLQNLAAPTSDFYINQPILQYGTSSYGGGLHWSLVAFHCHSSDVCPNSSFATPVHDGDVIFGNLNVINCSGGNCGWTIDVRDSNTAAETELGVTPDLDLYNNVVGGVVEVYNFGSCSQYPVNGVFFNKITAIDQTGTQVLPSWHTHVVPGTTPSCGFSVNQADEYTVKLYHNPGPAGTISSFTTNPNPPLLYQPFTLTLNGSGFNPTNVDVMFTQNCFPPNNISCPLSIMAANWSLTTKTSTQVVTPGMTFGTPGTLYITTRNGDGGGTGNWIQITLPQR